MTDAIPSDRPPLLSKAAANTSSATPSPTLPPSAAARQRLPPLNSSQQDSLSSSKLDPHLRRRSSLLSISSSIGDATQSFAGDFIDPRAARRLPNGEIESEVSHWHSSPLAFAILPAVGGLIFQNGSAFVTDILLLGLAAVFMNWSIRLPWDWYYSAQAIRRDAEPDYNILGDDLDDDDTTVKTASSTEGSPKPGSDRQADTTSDPRARGHIQRDEAVADLRRQEILALGATFAFPALACYLLHVIRAQLSTSSTGLVSDYNLSIFLLAAEVRPFRQVIRLITNRTIHLQRIATGADDPVSFALDKKNSSENLGSRLAALETRLSDGNMLPATLTVAQKGDINDLSVEIRKRYEPRLEGLERAMRRYEKRMAALSAQTDERLQSLEIRLRETLSLAAVVAQHSQNRGIMNKIFDGIYTVLVLPMQLAWEICIWPFRAVDELYWKTKTILLGPHTSGTATRRSKGGRHENGNATGRDDKHRDKGGVRKVVR